MFKLIIPGLSSMCYCTKGVILHYAFASFKYLPRSILVNILLKGMFCFIVNFLIVYCVNRALKTKHDTPKYGLIFHASLVGQTTPKHKGKVCRSRITT